MSKYAINKEFFFSELFTFPIVEPVLPLADAALDSIFYLPRSDRSVKVRRFTIPVSDGSIDALLYTPVSLKSDSHAPLLVYYHGGGFIYRAAPHHYRLMKQYAKLTPCKVLLVNYRTAPEHKFPTPVNDCVEAYRWAYRNYLLLGVDRRRMAVAGDSAGGALCAGTALMLRDTGFTSPVGMMLIYPVTDSRMITDSMTEYTDTPVWNSRLSKKMWRLYMPAADSEKQQYGAPMLAHDFSRLPASYTETAQFDSLHDEGVNFSNALRAAGNHAILHETTGTMHAFDMTSRSDITNDCLSRRTDFLREVFSSVK